MNEPITRDTSVREAIALLPGAEAIFDEHGLAGCGGPNGPQEPIGFFAAIHHVDPDALVSALNDYARRTAPPSTPVPAEEPAQPYRLFVATALLLSLGGGITSGIAAAMTGGGWGALRGESWLALVQTHGHIQLFGFVVLFICGIAFHVLPRFKRRQPVPARAVYATYSLLAGGVLLRALAQPHAQGWMRSPFAASALIEFAGALLFGALIFRVLASRELRETLDYYVTAAVFALVAAAAMNVYLTLDAARDGRRIVSTLGDESMILAATQGFAVLFVLGVASRILPFFLQLQPARERLLRVALAVLVVAIPVRVLATWAPDVASTDLSQVEHAAALAVVAGVIAAVVALRIFEEPASRAPSPMAPPAFSLAIHAAFAWLIAAVLLDGYWQLREIDGGAMPMYAAGAVRHSYLLGFATLMIMAMAYRTVPVFSGRPLPAPSLVPASFALVTAAALLRIAPVAFTVAPTDIDYKLMVAGGVLLFSGMSIFAVEIAVPMFGMRLPARAPVPAAEAEPARAAADETPAPSAEPASQPSRPGAVVTAQMTVAEALAAHPIVLELLLKRGFGPLATPDTRAAMAPITTIERASSFVGATPEDLVDYINRGIAAAESAAPPGQADALAVTMVDTSVDKHAVIEALEACYDPEVPVNIVDLGLVYDVLVREGYARVTMSMTSPGCPAADMLEADVRKALRAIDGIDSVDVEVVEEPAWTPARMSPAARARLGMA